MAKSRQKAKKKTKSNKLKIYSLLIIALMLISFFYICLKPNVNIRTDYCYFYIPKNSTSSSVYDSLVSKQLLKNDITFWITYNIFKYEKPTGGLYMINKSWGNFWFVKKLKEELKRPYYSYKIKEFKTRENTIRSICKQANINVKELKEVLEDSIFLEDEFKLNKESIYCIFVPGEYKMFKGRSGKQLLTDIYSEYKLFWNRERRKAAKKLKYSPEDVIKLASIVYAETKNKAEMPIIAGLYLNRLKKGIPLQADPTLVYARKNSGLKRVYFKYINAVSPYNTYKNKGLPPGPIGPAPLVAINAVLHPEEHNYLFFCAKEDFSGCHYFSENFEDHKKFARKYRSMLDKRKIK